MGAEREKVDSISSALAEQPNKTARSTGQPQRKDQLVSLTLCFTTQQVDRQREDKIKGNETMAYHHGGEGGKGWLSAKVLRVALGEDEKRKNEKTKK